MEQKCYFCGAVFRVEVPRLAGHEESEEYYCPECHSEYKTRASNSPSTYIISGRTDGRTINIYEFEKIQKEIAKLTLQITKKEN